jgi:hypothetical protein
VLVVIALCRRVCNKLDGVRGSGENNSSRVGSNSTLSSRL